VSQPDDKAEQDAAEEAEGPKVEAVSVGNHPRARASIRRTRTRAALIAFVLVLLLGLHAGQTAFDATWRALVAGLVVNIVVWRLSLYVWRQIVINEVRAAEEEREERRRARREEAEARAKAAAEQPPPQPDNPGFRAA
jgi:Zn-dependent protease with chaperone function